MIDDQVQSTYFGGNGMATAANAAPPVTDPTATPFVFNGAQDSQAANAALNLAPVTTDDTLTKIQSDKATHDKYAALGAMMVQAAQQQQASAAQQHIAQSNVDLRTPVLPGTPYATSSKALKTGPTEGAQAVIQRGATGQDPVDQNGVQSLSIQAITKRLDAAKKRLAQLQKERA